MTSERDQLDRLLEELASIQDRLLQDPPLDERAQLHDRQEALHAEARMLGKALHDEGSLDQARAQLAHLAEYRFRLTSAHVPHAQAPATDIGAGMAQRKLDDLYSRSTGAFELDQVEEEIRRLQQRIATLEAA